MGLKLEFPKNVFSAFGVLLLITAAIVPLENLINFGPEFSMHLYLSSELTAEKASLAVIGFALFLIFLGYKKKDF